MPADTTIGRAFVAYYADGFIYEGAGLDDWINSPGHGLVLCDVLEPLEYAPGHPYRWRMECEAYGCRQRPDGRLEFQRWHEPDVAPPEGWFWKRGQLISDAAMAEIRAVAN